MAVSDRSALIRVEHLSKTYSTGLLLKGSAEPTAAIRDISFDIARGETLGLVGRSGSGKTTIGRTMLRLVEPSHGRVVVNLPGRDSVDLMSLGSQELRVFRRHVQMVFQDPYTSLNPRMTVGDAVEEPLRIHRIVELERFSDSLGSDWARDERRERRGEVRRERVVDTAIECLQRFSPAECRNCFRHCGYSIATQS